MIFCLFILGRSKVVFVPLYACVWSIRGARTQIALYYKMQAVLAVISVLLLIAVAVSAESQVASALIKSCSG
jgi:hypothetical protein